MNMGNFQASKTSDFFLPAVSAERMLIDHNISFSIL